MLIYAMKLYIFSDKMQYVLQKIVWSMFENIKIITRFFLFLVVVLSSGADSMER